MLSLGLSSAGRSGGSSGNGGGAGNDAESTASTSSSGLLGGGTVDGRATTPASSTSASSSRARSRSPGSNSSPRFHRRTTGTGISRMDSPSQLPTIMSASNIHASNPEAMDFNQGAQYSSSPRSGQGFYINGGSDTGSKSRSSSLAMAGSAPRNISGATLPDPIGSGSPREGSRLYERGSASGSFTAASNLNSVFSSSFPSSGGIWSNEAATGNHNAGFNSAMPPPTSANPTRSSLSRHVSLSGAMPKTAIGLGTGTPPMRSSSNPAGWPESPMSVEEVALASSGDHRQGRSLTRGGYAGGSATNHQEHQGAGGAGSHLARSLSIASDRASNATQGNSGIAISNMSPFVRDLRGLPPVPQPSVGQPRVPGAGPTTAHPYSSSFTTANDLYSRGPATGVGSTFGISPSSLAAGERARPSLHGAVGSGRTSSMAPPPHRNRRESLWGDERPLREGDEDAYAYDDEDSEDDYAPPTRSGATSRRHSVAAFTSTSTLTALTSPPAMRSQIGFQVPSQPKPAANRPTNGGGNGSANTSIRTQQAQKSSDLFSSGGSRLDDEDLLATNLSSALQLNLEAHAAKQQRDEEEKDQQTGLHMRPTGLDSRASSMPVAVGAHFGFGSPPTQRQTAFGSVQPEQRGGLASTSPSRAVSSGAGPAQDRRSSTSGDPYSPSANVARYLATAHHGQPSQASRQGGASPVSTQQQLPHPRDLGTSPHGEGGLWPPSGTNVFTQHQQSPAFRGGTLPPPDMLPHFSSHNGPAGHVAATYGGLQPLPPNAPTFGGRGPSPTGPMQQHGLGNAISPQPPSSFLPPFAGFSSAPRMAGPPPPALSPMNASAQPYFVPPIAPQPNLNDLGRGVPLHALPAGGPLYIVEFKAGRTDLFYVEDPDQLTLKKGDLVVVEADRGKDLGKCLTSCTLDEVRDFQMHQVESALGQLAANAGGGATIGGIGTLPPGQQPSAAAIARMTKEIHPKKIYGRASPADVALLAVKAGDEQKALNVCRAKVLQHQLPMEVTDAEFQFDRRRLTFFYIADRRIDFRSLVKDLFRLYKTRIWLCAIDNGVLQR